MAIEIREITSYAAFCAMKESWNRLVKESGADSLFLRHEWFDCWWQAFGSGKRRMRILAAYQAGALKGIAPLVETTTAGGRVLIEFMQDSNAPRCDFILARNDRETLSALIGHLKTRSGNGWDCCRLSNIPADSWTLDALAEACRHHKVQRGVVDGLRSPVIPVAGTWDAFVGAKSSRFSKTLRYCVNKAQRMGTIEYLEVTDAGQFPGLVQVLAGISARSWKKAQAGDLARSAENEAFFRLLTDTASKNGWLSVWLLKAKEEDIPVAYEYHLRYEGEEFALRADFDMAYAQFSPGSALEAHIIRRAFERGIRSYDLCGNDYAYKMRWTDRVRRHSTVEVYNTSARATALFFIRHRVTPLARSLGLGKLKLLLSGRRDT